MLLRGSQTHAGFTVPVVKRRLVEKADPLRERLDRITSSALEKRNDMDARLSVARESGRSRLSLIEKLNEAGERGETGKGFAKRFEAELKKAKAERLAEAANPRALETLKAQSDDLDREFQLRALKTEANTRARERIETIGKAFDDLVAAASANPQRFEALHESARSALVRMALPSKAAAAFRARLPEIPRAALLAFVERDPAQALDFVQRRKGPARAKFGVEQDVLRLIGKQAKAKLDEDEGAPVMEKGVQATRMLVDRRGALEALQRGEGSVEALSLEGLGDAGGAHARELVRDIRGARRDERRRQKLATLVRSRLVTGQKLDPDSEAHGEGLDLFYAQEAQQRGAPGSEDDEAIERDVGLSVRAGLLPKTLVKTINEMVLGDDDGRVIVGVKMIEALERADEALTRPLRREALAEAHEILDIVRSGVDWREAVRLARESTDADPAQRHVRDEAFARQAAAFDLPKAIAEALGVPDDEAPSGD